METNGTPESDACLCLVARVEDMPDPAGSPFCPGHCAKSATGDKKTRNKVDHGDGATVPAGPKLSFLRQPHKRVLASIGRIQHNTREQ